ncbi:FAD-dependent oxidoreductase, partial [Leptospira stimsonii]|uniref:FAD-dependent oxidoreductase n=1 Tax=Leptospira stimsonii TaxID=2202203 RepID=UPI003CCFE550
MSADRELEISKLKNADKKHVVVIGSGPGGLESARISAIRGHKVTVLEASDKIGGQLNLAA